MATSKEKQIPRDYNFELVEGTKLQITVSGSSSGRNVRIEFQLKNCSRTWILHWGFRYRGNTNWFIPSEHPRPGGLQTPFVKTGETYLVTIELRDPKIHAIEFVLKDAGRDRWLRLNHGNFRIEIPEIDTNTLLPSIPKDLIEHKAFQIWESRGKPQNSPQQQKQDYNDALRDLHLQLSNGISLTDLHKSHMPSHTKTVPENREKFKIATPTYPLRIHDVEKWLHKNATAHAMTTTLASSSFLSLVENSIRADYVVSRQSYHMGHEIAVLSYCISSDYPLTAPENLFSAHYNNYQFQHCKCLILAPQCRTFRACHLIIVSSSWQVISPVEVCGFVTSVTELIISQNKVYRRPTVIIASRITGEEEIPVGVVAVVTPDLPDVLSHISIRARNNKVCFATCFDQDILRNLKLKEGKAVSIQVKSTNLIIR